MTARAFVATMLLAVLASACSHNSAKSGSGTSVFKVKVGECVVPPTEVKAEITSVKVVPCSSPHTQEVFAILDYAATGPAAVTTTSSNSFPGETVLRKFADGACLQQFARYVGVDYRDSTLFYTYLLPSARSWSAKDRKVVCFVTTTGQQLAASVKSSRI